VIGARWCSASPTSSERVGERPSATGTMDGPVCIASERIVEAEDDLYGVCVFTVERRVLPLVSC
jgi:hypothetical protein